jgi:hypothetical protein
MQASKEEQANNLSIYLGSLYSWEFERSDHTCTLLWFIFTWETDCSKHLHCKTHIAKLHEKRILSYNNVRKTRVVIIPLCTLFLLVGLIWREHLKDGKPIKQNAILSLNPWNVHTHVHTYELSFLTTPCRSLFLCDLEYPGVGGHNRQQTCLPW